MIFLWEDQVQIFVNLVKTYTYILIIMVANC